MIINNNVKTFLAIATLFMVTAIALGAFGAHGLTASDVGAVASNNAITEATKTKITYDSKGLVTAGADASLDDIPDGLTRKLSNYVPKTLTVNGQALSSNVSLALGNLNDVTTTNPQTADLLRYNGTNWTNAPASGTYAGPTETYLGSRTSSGYISVANIDNFDEIIIELYTFYTYYWDQEEVLTTTDVFVTRTILPHNKFEHYSRQKRDDYNSIGASLTTVNPYSNDIISVKVSRRNASGTELDIWFTGTLSGVNGGIPWGIGVRIFGRNW